ncbi:MAG TPA: urease accessory UreF family protein [Acidimicrobiales bacterium]|nr:urease accessory UreF family protein [Acidimicrobiales bacterium]
MGPPGTADALRAPGPLLAVLLLGDGRFPAGGHAHSAGVEAAVADGRIACATSLRHYLRGRLWTAGLTDAAMAAATAIAAAGGAGTGTGGSGDRSVHHRLVALDAEAEARIAPAPLRAASRRLGAQLLRAAGRCWPVALVETARAVHLDGPHQPVALGATVVAAGGGPTDAAGLAVHHALTTPAQAAVRLLGLDPFEAAAAVAGLGGEAGAVVAEAVAAASGPPADLPCRAGIVTDISAVHRAGSDRRLFVT